MLPEKYTIYDVHFLGEYAVSTLQSTWNIPSKHMVEARVCIAIWCWKKREKYKTSLDNDGVEECSGQDWMNRSIKEVQKLIYWQPKVAQAIIAAEGGRTPYWFT